MIPIKDKYMRYKVLKLAFVRKDALIAIYIYT